MYSQGSYSHGHSVPNHTYDYTDQQHEVSRPRSTSTNLEVPQPMGNSPIGDRPWETYPDRHLPGWQRQSNEPAMRMEQHTSDAFNDLGNFIQPLNQSPYLAGASQQSQLPPPLPQYGGLYTGKAHTVQGSPYSPIQPSDSGYGSQQQYTLPFDQTSRGSHDHLQSPNTEFNSFDGRVPARSVISENLHTKRRRLSVGSSNCDFPGCTKTGMRNKSDRQKHKATHDKPHRCRVPGCPRQREGFGTANDLQRHVNSLHHELAIRSKISGSGYVCAQCARESPQTKPKKWWPRKDNFKCHVERKHADKGTAKVDQIIDESKRPIRPADTIDESEVKSTTTYQEGEDRHFSHGAHLVGSLPADRHIHCRTSAIVMRDSESLMGSQGAWSNQTQHLATPTMFDGHSNGPRLLESAGLDNETSPTSTLRPSPAPWELDHSSQWEIDAQKRHPVDTLLPTRSSSGDSQGESGQFFCEEPGCKKWKKRKCDLRKHMKRHTKPYGCTFSKCSKTFGSLNDWKRHENTQHDLDEAWRCEVGRPDNKKCGRMFSKKEDFEAHLNGPHGEDLRNVHLETLINAFHLGRGGHHHFWCGFCDRLIAPPENQDQEKSNPRFKHIGDHFDKEKRNIGDWMDIEANMLKRAMPETNPKYSRNSTMTTESADDSDLGDDGIGIPMTFAHHAQSEYGLEVARQSGFRMYDLDEDEEDGRFKGGIDV